MNAQFRIQDKIDEAKQHLEVLKELRDEVSFLYDMRSMAKTKAIMKQRL